MPKERAYPLSFALEIKLLILNAESLISERNRRNPQGERIKAIPKLNIFCGTEIPLIANIIPSVDSWVR